MIKIMKSEDESIKKEFLFPTPFFNYTKTTKIDSATGKKNVETSTSIKSFLDIIIDGAITSFIVRKGIKIGKSIKECFKNKTTVLDESFSKN